MCGLVGMAGNFYFKHEKMMKYLLMFDTLRGIHSTGLASVDKDRDIFVFKKAIPGWEFADDPVLDKMLRGTDRVWLGHNRHATIGKINRLNAHPFVIEDKDSDPYFVGAHNGTIHDKDRDIDDASWFGTDSEGLMNMIAEKGSKEAVSNLSGAWALSWYDRRNDTLNFLRNKERPLFFCYVTQTEAEVGKKQETVAWASEIWMLEAAAAKAELHLGKMYYFDTDKHYWFKLPDKVGEDFSLNWEEGHTGKVYANFTGTTGRGYSGGRSQTGGQWNQVNERWDDQKKQWVSCSQTTKETKKEEVTTSTPSTAGEPTTDGSKKEGNVIELPINGTVRRSTGPRLNNDSAKQTNNSSTDKGKSSETNSSTTTSPRSFPNLHNVKYKGFDGERISVERLDEVLRKGCAWCEDKIPQQKNSPWPIEPVGWLSSDEVVCTSCIHDLHGKETEDEKYVKRTILSPKNTKKTSKDKKREEVEARLREAFLFAYGDDKIDLRDANVVKSAGLTNEEIVLATQAEAARVVG